MGGSSSIVGSASSLPPSSAPSDFSPLPPLRVSAPMFTRQNIHSLSHSISGEHTALNPGKHRGHSHSKHPTEHSKHKAAHSRYRLLKTSDMRPDDYPRRDQAQSCKDLENLYYPASPSHSGRVHGRVRPSLQHGLSSLHIQWHGQLTLPWLWSWYLRAYGGGGGGGGGGMVLVCDQDPSGRQYSLNQIYIQILFS